MTTTGEKEFRRIAEEMCWHFTDEAHRLFGERLDKLLTRQRWLTVEAMREKARTTWWYDPHKLYPAFWGPEIPDEVVNAGLSALPGPPPEPAGPFGPKCNCGWKRVAGHEWMLEIRDSTFVTILGMHFCLGCGERRVAQ